MYRGEPLQALHSPESEHCALSSSEREMAALDAVVGVSSDGLFVSNAEVSQGGSVGLEPVGGDRVRGAMPLQRTRHEARRRRLVARPGDVALQYLTLVIDGTHR